ncbi:MAG TPA: gamma-glutamyltransferase [Thermomicrobiales bacterium]|nr:gamma-glutamyltransferase [Thermomicrobiales bacterium]
MMTKEEGVSEVVRRSVLVQQKVEVTSDAGLVAAESEEAAEAGAEIFEAGGNAIDAAVATSFTAAVCEPAMTSIGGGGAALVYLGETGETFALEFNGRLPHAAHENMFLDDLLPPGESLSPFSWRGTRDNVAWMGYRTLGVPGHPAGVLSLHERFGTLPRSTVLAPAIRRAREGYDINPYYSLLIGHDAKHILRFPSLAHMLLPDGRPPVPRDYYNPNGHRVVQPQLAETLEMIAEGGIDAFYRGDVARAIVEDNRPHGAIVTLEDYAAYEPRWYDDGLRTDYRGYTVVAMPDAFGGVNVLETLNILERFNLARSGHNTPQTLHLLVEALRLSWSDRFRHMGDPEFEDVPIRGLISKAYADERRGLIDARQAPDEIRPGDPWPYQGMRAPANEKPGGTHPPGNETTHMVTADAQGNMVSLVQTLGGEFGSRTISPSTGIIQRNYTNLFNPEPGTKNSIGPWKRPLSHDSLVLILKNGRAIAAVGAPGGRRVIPAVIQVILNIIDFGMGIQDAIGAPRIHAEGCDPKVPEGLLVRTVFVDSRIPAETRAAMEAMGHEIVVMQDGQFALPVGLLRDEAGLLHGGVTVPVPAMAIGL